MPLLGVAGLVVGLIFLNRIRHKDRSPFSTVVVGLGFAFGGTMGLLLGASYLTVVLHVPHPDPILVCLLFVFASLQTVLAVRWLGSPPKRLWR